MSGIATYLSPNGQDTSHGTGPATRLVVATVGGVVTLAPAGGEGPWDVVDRSLTDRHVGALMFEPSSGKLFAANHRNGGLWVSDDGAGADWRRLENGLDRPHVYTVAARPGRPAPSCAFAAGPSATAGWPAPCCWRSSLNSTRNDLRPNQARRFARQSLLMRIRPQLPPHRQMI